MTRAVSSNPAIRGGELCIHGTRLPVRVLVVRHLAGESVASLARDYDKDPKQIRAALKWASNRIQRLRVRKSDVVEASR